MRVSFKSFWTVYIYIWEVCILIISLYGAWYVEVECTIYWGRKKTKRLYFHPYKPEKYIHLLYIYFMYIFKLQRFWKRVCVYIYIYIYHINCGVIQRFPALRKVVMTHVFTRVDIANQLLTRNSPLAPLGQFDEWTAKPSRFSIQIVCRSFLELWRLKH